MPELFRIATDRLVLTWSAAGDGPAEEPGPRPVVRALREGARPRVEAAATGAVLEEQAEYQLLLRARTAAPVDVRHRDPVVLSGLHRADGGRIVHGRVGFGSQVGRSSFVLLAAGEPELEFEVEVRPTKLGHADDYPRLVAETREILTSLAFEYLRATFRPGRAAARAHPAGLEWLTLLRHGVDDLACALEEVARRPLRGLARDPRPTRAERVGRPDAALRRAVARGAGTGRLQALPGGEPVREHLPERRARPTLDTPEHRWLAARLDTVRRRLAALRGEEAARPAGPRRDRILAELDALEERVGRLSRLEPLAAASAPPPPGFASLQLLSAPGYAEAYRAVSALARGLGLEEGPLRLPLKDVHVLYEYWCALTLVRTLADALGTPMPAAQLLATEGHGLRVRLRPGHEGAVTLDAPDGTRVTLTYNPRFAGDSLLVPQRPDFLLGVHRPGRAARFAVLDAKYRLDDSPGYVRRFGSPGPPEDALNTLHRYRDAIVRPAAGAHARLADTAVALFPYREPHPGAFRASRLRRSLETLGIGALPLLPGETGYLQEWVRERLG